MSTRFDALAQLYEDMFDLPWRRDLESSTVLGLLGDLTGKAVLDLGCGTGHYCRLLERAGAGRVVGYDTFEGMIVRTSRRESQEALGVEYTHLAPGPASAGHPTAWEGAAPSSGPSICAPPHACLITCRKEGPLVEKGPPTIP
ncbi:methyltransferase domain-containing protein [Nonomuraea sp. PA05]|uniref:class I SAM-dependent methyltransferase n=1 Tax=Nonomuraea sp. PA05 TaxID=2604466 RepID=UPI0011DAF4F4|nr:class I SAM-dependent methyltransferase [Nonomuraea sp. PA05]TYB69326.1 methyltransferase domain-containing protein [Nonomuraea sp. PA05]